MSLSAHETYNLLVWLNDNYHDTLHIFAQAGQGQQSGQRPGFDALDLFRAGTRGSGTRAVPPELPRCAHQRAPQSSRPCGSYRSSLVKRVSATNLPTKAASSIDSTTASGCAVSQIEVACSDSKKRECWQKVALTQSRRSAGMIRDSTLPAGCRSWTLPSGVTSNLIGWPVTGHVD